MGAGQNPDFRSLDSKIHYLVAAPGFSSSSLPPGHFCDLPVNFPSPLASSGSSGANQKGNQLRQMAGGLWSAGSGDNLRVVVEIGGESADQFPSTSLRT